MAPNVMVRTRQPFLNFYQNNLDIDECTEGSTHDLEGTHNCSNDAACTNQHGSFGCICNAGFSGNGMSCIGK